MTILIDVREKSDKIQYCFLIKTISLHVIKCVKTAFYGLNKDKLINEREEARNRLTCIQKVDLQQKCVGILIECSNQRKLILLIQYIEEQD